MSSNPVPLPLLCLLALAVALGSASDARAETGWRDLNRAAIDGHIVPRYRLLDGAARSLDARLRLLCEGPTDTSLASARDGFRIALDAWNGISHIRFGPVETEQRYFRFQLWPDKRGTGGRQVRELLAVSDDARLEPAAFAKESVAVQGLSALEMLLFPESEVAPANFAGAGGANRCRLVRAIGRNVSDMAAAVLGDWTQGERSYRDALLDPRPEPGPAAAASPPRFADARSVSAELLRSLSTGAQVIHQQKLAEPLGRSAEEASPRRAESWRSRQSLANVCTNLRAMEHLYATGFALVLRETPESAEKDRGLALTLSAATSACLAQPGGLLDEPVTPEQRRALEDLLELAGALQARTGRALAEELDLTLGFNSLDGD